MLRSQLSICVTWNVRHKRYYPNWFSAVALCFVNRWIFFASKCSTVGGKHRLYYRGTMLGEWLMSYSIILYSWPYCYSLLSVFKGIRKLRESTGNSGVEQEAELCLCSKATWHIASANFNRASVQVC